MRFPTPALWLAALLGLSQCKNNDPDPAKPENQLPPATQTGVHSFGCLVDGKPFTPGLGNTYVLLYDAGYAGGSLDIRASRHLPALQTDQHLSIGGGSITKTGTYAVSNTGPCGVYYTSGIKGSCYEYYQAPGLLMTGQLVVTRLDRTQGIVAGTFHFNLWQPGCDTVKVTHGRFDYKL